MVTDLDDGGDGACCNNMHIIPEATRISWNLLGEDSRNTSVVVIENFSWC